MSAQPSVTPTSSVHRVVIRETRRSRATAKIIMGLLVLLSIASLVSAQERLGMELLANPLVAFALMFVCVGFGVVTILAWRQSGHFEVVEVIEQRVRLMVAPFKKPFFDAPVSETRVQCLTLPKGGLKLFLRDGVKAVEIGGDLPTEDRRRIAQRLDALVTHYVKAGV